MENELFKVIINNGAWAILFVWLLIDTRKEGKIREENLKNIIDKNQEIISNLAEKFDVVDNIQHDVTDIKMKLDKKG
ncbi:BhlA/UviB family holin-like peptide [Clostridium sp.]|uniref:BhlA/UviB family holin-like peptide n=1 Tax=Clostridium sp. TaxID=1506 RepID=UPI00290F8C3E|nr:BhlA/UviB family holin-like peptide [Clostridium sp.]MDU3524247.1 BhlA/UviB family holin-like peptide [Clostridium sp.]MDU3546276.1 BhlA/UviB family holin-like peptide [Clostridium sp.]MDU6363285.1 BhlA/UviB family holin-like peptide [Clostridium sp.]